MTRPAYGSTHDTRPDTLSSIPPHVRPKPSRNASSSSTVSSSSRRPYRQQREYVPVSIDGTFAGDPSEPGISERWEFEQAQAQSQSPDGAERDSKNPPSYRRHSDGSAGAGSSGDSGAESDNADGSEADWEAARAGSINDRPRWRRPSPKWVYPFVIGATLAMGAGAAPRSEVYINLACLAHPPQAPKSVAKSASNYMLQDHYGQVMGLSSPLQPYHVMTTGDLGEDMIISDPGVTPVPVPAPGSTELSPADRWFLQLQHDIYEYNLHHLHGSKNSSTPVATPSGPIPHPSTSPRKPAPTAPSPGNRQPPTDEPEPAEPPFHEIDPRLCKKDANVQAAAARLTMIMTLTMGILSALTTGYWGQTSDRLGRTRVMALVELGFLFNEICFVLVASFPYLAPGGYRSLLIGPILEGFLGGFSTLSATLNAYVSDTTPDGSRATVFARVGGFAMSGLAIGPLIGSAAIRMTGNIMVPFYVNIGVHICLFILILLVLPESLSTDARRILTKNAQLAHDAKKRRDVLEREWENETPAIEATDPLQQAGSSGWSRRFSMNQPSSRRQKKAWGNVKRIFRRMTGFLTPLEVFVPRKKDDGGRDWNLTLTGAALFMMSNLYGIMQVKTQYTFYAFGWTSAQLGPYLSLMGFSRGLVMLALLPFAMYIAKPYFLPTNNSASVPTTASQPNAPNESDPLIPVPPKTKPRRPAILDLYTARISLFIESSMYILLSLGLSPIPFVAVTALVTLGSGSNPAANSLALSFIPNSREAGKLFGGLAVLHALGATLLGPLMFGNLFASTVGTYAPAVFALAAGVQMISLILFMFVRMPNQAVDTESAKPRGRSTRKKRVNSSGFSATVDS